MDITDKKLRYTVTGIVDFAGVQESEIEEILEYIRQYGTAEVTKLEALNSDEPLPILESAAPKPERITGRQSLADFVELADAFEIVFVGKDDYHKFKELYDQLKQKYGIRNKTTPLHKKRFEAFKAVFGWRVGDVL